MNKLDVLIVGGGGREHALAWKIAASPLVDRVYCAPGNGGTVSEEKTSNVNIQVDDFAGLTNFALEKKIGFVVIGPDNPLADGIVDHMESHGLMVFGPLKESARLESSKAHAKAVMTKLGIPTARFEVFDNKQDALAFAKKESWARIVKVDGLALGKGVFVCDSIEEVEEALGQIFDQASFGKSGESVVIEERLEGEELSMFLLLDGKTAIVMAPSQDHKCRFDNDLGPNTGGMGAYSPVPLYDLCKKEIEEQIIKPIAEALANGKLQYKGVLFIGLMVCRNASGSPFAPYVLEFNARFGDPETQAILPRLKSDLVPALIASATGRLDQISLEWDSRYSCCVVACADSYPQSSSRGEAITIGGSGRGTSLGHDTYVFHAGTKLTDGRLTTNGGRVLSVTALSEQADDARHNAYEALKTISFNGMDYRKDIAWRIVTKCHSR